jgi:hypothetical protein
MSIYTMTKAQLIAKAERDDAAVRRAAATLKDNADLQAKVAELRRELAEEKAKPPKVVEVPGPVKTVTKEIPGPVQYVKVKVPGPVRYVEKPVKVEVPVEVIVEHVLPCPMQAAEIAKLREELERLKK